MKKKFIFNVSVKNLEIAIHLAQTFLEYYNTPKWDKQKVLFDKKFNVHETKTNTVVITEL